MGVEQSFSYSPELWREIFFGDSEILAISGKYQLTHSEEFAGRKERIFLQITWHSIVVNATFYILCIYSIAMIRKENFRNMEIKLDKRQISFGNVKDLNAEDRDYWAKASLEEKLEMINYLRECFYGDEATTGRLQRIFEFSKQK